MAVKTLDVRGEICPDPLTLTLKEIEALKAGDILNVIVDSPLALETICRWVGNAGHKLVGVSELEEGQWQITIERKGA